MKWQGVVFYNPLSKKQQGRKTTTFLFFSYENVWLLLFFYNFAMLIGGSAIKQRIAMKPKKAYLLARSKVEIWKIYAKEQ